MSIYIEDTKKKTIRHYCTTPKIEKAIETLLRMDDELVGSESHEGYEVAYKNIKEDQRSDVVSLGVFEQVKWERDVAIDQLNALGYGFGEKPRNDAAYEMAKRVLSGK